MGIGNGPYIDCHFMFFPFTLFYYIGNFIYSLCTFLLFYFIYLYILYVCFFLFVSFLILSLLIVFNKFIYILIN